MKPNTFKRGRFVYSLPCTRLQNFVNVSPLLKHMTITFLCLVGITINPYIKWTDRQTDGHADSSIPPLSSLGGGGVYK